MTALHQKENTEMKRFIAIITLAFAVFSMTQPAFARNESDALLIESTTWGAAAYSENPEIIRDYLNRYPDGLYTDDARQRLDDLERKQWEAIMDALTSKRFSGITRTQAYEQAYDDLQMKFPDSEFLLLADQRQWEAITDDLSSALLYGINRIQAYEQVYDNLQKKFPDSEFLLFAKQGAEEIRLNMEQRIKEWNEIWKEVLIFLLFIAIIYSFPLFLRCKYP